MIIITLLLMKTEYMRIGYKRCNERIFQVYFSFLYRRRKNIFSDYFYAPSFASSLSLIIFFSRTFLFFTFLNPEGRNMSENPDHNGSSLFPSIAYLSCFLEDLYYPGATLKRDQEVEGRPTHALNKSEREQGVCCDGGDGGDGFDGGDTIEKMRTEKRAAVVWLYKKLY